MNHEIKFDNRPDLVVHDSGGFEAGAEEELETVKDFLVKKSQEIDISSRLHVIWYASNPPGSILIVKSNNSSRFCVDASSERIMQMATSKLFEAASKFVKDVPIIAVLTKKDLYMNNKWKERYDMFEESGADFDPAECKRYANDLLQLRIQLVEAEMLGLKTRAKILQHEELLAPLQIRRDGGILQAEEDIEMRRLKGELEMLRIEEVHQAEEKKCTRKALRKDERKLDASVAVSDSKSHI